MHILYIIILLWIHSIEKYLNYVGNLSQSLGLYVNPSGDALDYYTGSRIACHWHAWMRKGHSLIEELIAHFNTASVWVLDLRD